MMTSKQEFIQTDVFTRESVRIPTVLLGCQIHAWKYVVRNFTNGKTQPAIILAQGLTGVKRMGLHEYAKRFCEANYACIVFDFRRWGASDGEPRNCVKVSEQLDDYRSVIKWARQQPEFNPQRIVLWGTGLSGGHIITLAAEQSLNIYAAIGQGSFLGITATRWSRPVLILLVILDLLMQAFGFNPLYIPVSPSQGQTGLYSTPGAAEAALKLAAGSDWPNQVSASSVSDVAKYRPATGASNVKCPILMVAPRGDLFHAIEHTRAVLRETPSVLLHEIDGGHFDIYPGFDMFEETVTIQLDFLHKLAQ